MKHLGLQGSVFGAAPSLEAMKSINKVKAMYRGATFWYYFRVYLPYFYPVLFLIFMILALTTYSNIEGNLVLGSVLSLFMGISVVVSYIMIVPWRKHPSSLILNRTLCNMFFSLVIIFEAISTTDSSCSNYAMLTQFTVLASEGWLTTIALDLMYSLTNPFVSYKVNLRKYQVMVGLFTFFITTIFWNDSSCQGQFEAGICWIKIDSTNSPCLWGYFLFWMVCMYAYQIYASVYAYFRLKKGLSTSFEVRKKCAQETFTCLMIYAAYMSFLVFLFSIIASDPSPEAGSSMARFSLFFLFLVANRGSVDGIVWFLLHDFQRDSSSSGSAKTASLEEGQKDIEMTETEGESETGEEEEGGEESEGEDGERLLAGRVKAKKIVKDVEKSVTKTITELADLAIADLDETDLSPQVNLALRQQVVQYVTLGVRNAVKKVHINNRPGEEIKDIMDNIFKKPDIAITPGLPVLDFYIDNEYLFKAFAPDLFRTLRQNEGISDDLYLQILSASANERLSEGASGAFMFFCGGGEFIVKTIRAREARVLHQSLTTYSTYLQKHPESLLCRILGSYSLEMFSQVFYFVVMLNCFDPKAEINERFDIKGSWVGRSAEPPKKGKRVVCRHCNEYFTPGKKGEECKVMVGPHEANVVLKDNDLRVKISLPPAQAQKVLNILKRDSDLLGKIGVLDYSLLLGVKKRKFGIEGHTEEAESKSKEQGGKNHFGPSSFFEAYSVTGPAVYHLGIVDFLQNWTVGKKVERAFKIYLKRKDPDGLSVMHPMQYKLRFQAKMDQIFDLDFNSANIVAMRPKRQLSDNKLEVESSPISAAYMAAVHSPVSSLSPSLDVVSSGGRSSLKLVDRSERRSYELDEDDEVF